MILTGTLVNIEARKGDFADRQTGEQIAYDFHLLTVRDQSGSLVEVKVRKDDASAVEKFKLDGPVTLHVDLPGKTRVTYNHARTVQAAPAVRSAS